MERIPSIGSRRLERRARRPRRLRAALLVEALESRHLLSMLVFQGEADADWLPPESGAVAVSGNNNPPAPTAGSQQSSLDINIDTNNNVPNANPHNETSIAVNPNRSSNMIGGANDYQFTIEGGQRTDETAYTWAHVTIDGGQNWTDYEIPYNKTFYNFTGDPAVAYDATGRAYLATLANHRDLTTHVSTSPDILVATSSPNHQGVSGQNWSVPVQVAQGTGGTDTNGITTGTLNDKEYIAAWGRGNAIVTWTVFNYNRYGNYIDSPIYASVTHDGGQTWSSGVPISGDLFINQFSVPVIAADGSIYVSFLSGDGETAANSYRDEYMVVKVDPATGQPLGSPVAVGPVHDGIYDYPVNTDRRQTYQDSQLRTSPAGNIAADPTDPSHLAVVWSDTRNNPYPDGALPPSCPTSDSYPYPDPYVVQTNSDIIISQSFDGGKSWSPSTAIRLPNDQFMPWATYDAQGRLQIGTFDRSYDRLNHMYGYTLASEQHSCQLDFALTQATTTLSDPTQGDAWFATTVNRRFPNATRFLGDYSGIAVTPNGGVAMLWTDMRNPVDNGGSYVGWSQDAYFSLVTPTGSCRGALTASSASGQAVDAVIVSLVDPANDIDTLLTSLNWRRQNLWA